MASPFSKWRFRIELKVAESDADQAEELLRPKLDSFS
jgi:hypothetical protein